MFWRNCVRALLVVCLLPSAAVALGLGDIHLNSSLNAPLDADIDVVGATPEELADFKPSLASRETFGRYGLDYPAFLSGVTLQLVRGSDGRNLIHLRSTDPIAEPFATVLVEVNWARGRLVREYTVLLDPPVFAQPGAAAAVMAPTTGAVRTGGIQRPSAPAAAPALPAPASPVGSAAAASPPVAASSATVSAPAPGGSSAAGSAYTVRSGDTLSSIAARNYSLPDRSARAQALAGIYRANLSAFDGNMNALRSGSRLALPTAAEVAAISPGEASAEVRAQYSAWVAHGHAAAPASGAGQLRLVPPQQAPAAAPAAGASSGAAVPAPSGGAGSAAVGSATSSSATGTVQQRVQQLEAQLAEQQRLLNARNAELAALQAQLARSTPAAAPSVAQPPPLAPPTQPPAPAAAPNAPAASAAPSAPPAVAPAPEAAAPKMPPAPAPGAAAAKPAPQASGGSFLDTVAEYWYVPAGLVLLAIGVLVLRIVRGRQEEEFDRSLNRLGSMTLDQPPARAAGLEREAVPLRTNKPERSFLVEESGSHAQPPLSSDVIDPGTTMARHVSVDEDVAADAPASIEQGDPLAEADFHMAYGLYDQAADQVQMALQREPDRRDLKLKLLEVFFVWGNKDRFLQSARELAASRDQALSGEWEKVLIMGRQIAPEDPLFAGAEALRGAASAGVDLNLEGGQNRIDFDLLGEPSVGPSGGEQGVDLDLGAALGDAQTAGEAHKLGDTGVDFVLDDPQRGSDRISATDITGTSDRGPDVTGSTREMPGTASGETATVQAPIAEEAPTVEQPQIHPGAGETIRTKLDAPNRPGTAADQTAELAIDDLGLDLGALNDSSDLGSDESAATLLTNVDDESRRLMARAEAERKEGEVHGGASGTWLFTDTDFATVVRTTGEGEAPTEVVRRPGEGEGTSQLPALSGLDLDLGDFSGDKGGLDLDVGAANGGDDGDFHRTQQIPVGEVAAADVEPATLSEVGTKLDLARAYMDMGDPDGARSILQEVLTEGSVAQKQEARRLMDTLPG